MSSYLVFYDSSQTFKIWRPNLNGGQSYKNSMLRMGGGQFYSTIVFYSKIHGKLCIFSKKLKINGDQETVSSTDQKEAFELK